MIQEAVLYDIRSYKVTSSYSFYRHGLDESQYEEIANLYLQALGDSVSDSCLQIQYQNSFVFISRVEEFVILICIPADESTSENMSYTQVLANRYKSVAEKHDIRKAREMFGELVQETLVRTLRICFLLADLSFSSEYPQNQIFQTIDDTRYSRKYIVGPYLVKYSYLKYNNLFDNSEFLANFDVFILVVSHETNMYLLKEIIPKLKEYTNTKMTVLPSSESNMELARSFEFDYDIVLCDSIAVSVLHLTLSILAVTGFLDMHPELAEKRLVTDSVFRDKQEEDTTYSGLQAFFVVDKFTGNANYSFFYHEKSLVLERSPNVLAAVSMFRIPSIKDSDETSIVQTGDLKYAIIERENLLFTMVAGRGEDIERIRGRFGSLPSLYLEDPPTAEINSDTFYNTPAFTLKLLAIFPPEIWSDQLTPVRLTAPNWEKFENPLVGDFLKTVWSSLNDITRLDVLLDGDKSGLLLGGLQLLKLMGYIDVHVVLDENDVAKIRKPLTDELRRMYSGLENLYRNIDGTNSIKQIANASKIDQSVVLRVLTELLKQDIIEIVNN